MSVLFLGGGPKGDQVYDVMVCLQHVVIVFLYLRVEHIYREMW